MLQGKRRIRPGVRLSFVLCLLVTDCVCLGARACPSFAPAITPLWKLSSRTTTCES